MIDKARRNSIRARWEACHPANGEDDVMALLDALDELEQSLDLIISADDRGFGIHYCTAVARSALEYRS